MKERHTINVGDKETVMEWHSKRDGMFLFEWAKPDDRKRIEKLIRLCGKGVADYFSMRNTDEYWAHREVWVCWLGGQPVAFTVLHPLKREPVQSLYQVGVHPEWRGLGLATKLVLFAMSAHPDRKTLRLVVSEGNVAAQHVYAKWGLNQISIKETRRNGMVFLYEGVPSWISQ